MRLWMNVIIFSIILGSNLPISSAQSKYLDDMYSSYNFDDDDFSVVSKKRKRDFVSYQDVADQAFIKDTEVMNSIINKYQQHGLLSLSVSEQQEFKSRLMKLQQYVDHLDPAKHDVKVYRTKFLNPYKMWTKYILVKPTPKQLAVLHENNEVKKILRKVSDKIDDALGKFSNTVHKMVEGLEGYSKQNVSELYSDLSGAVKTFESQMKSLHDRSLSDYYSWARSVGQTIDPRDLTPQQHDVVRTIRHLVKEALLRVRALALQLTAQQHAQDFANHMLDELKRYDNNEPSQEAEYTKILNENEKQFDQASWSDLKKEGGAILSDFANTVKADVKKEVSTYIKNYAQRYIGDILGA